MSELKAKAVFEGLRFLSLGSTKLHLKGYRFFFSFSDFRGTELGMNYYGIKAPFFIRMYALELTLGLCIASSVCSHSALPLSVKCIRIWKAPVPLCLLPFCDFIRHCQQQGSKGSSAHTF